MLCIGDVMLWDAVQVNIHMAIWICVVFNTVNVH